MFVGLSFTNKTTQLNKNMKVKIPINLDPYVFLSPVLGKYHYLNVKYRTCYHV